MHQTLAWLDAGKESKLARRSTGNATDDFDELAIFCEFDNPAVAISIGNEDVPVGSDSYVIGTVKQVMGIVISRDTFLSEGHQQFSIHVELVDDVVPAVGCPNETKAVHIYTVCALEHAVAERIDF